MKAAAAIQGESIKDYVLKCTLPDTQEQQALKNLETLLKPRVEAAKQGEISTKTVDAIFDSVLKASK